MTELQLYRFVNENKIEWHRRDNEGKSDIIMFPMFFHLDEFIKLVGNCTEDGGVQCWLKNGYIAIWMNDVCDYFGIDPDKIFID